MLRLTSGILFSVILCVGTFVSQADASEGGLYMTSYMTSYASLASLEKVGHMGDWLSELLAWLRQYRGGTNGGSVPVPGTFLAFGLGFAGLIAWRAVHSRK